jgi:hypothetical protein
MPFMQNTFANSSYQAVHKINPLKKQQHSITNFANEFLVNIKGELVRLQKGMSQAEVKSVLGDPIKIEPCENDLNQ